MRLCLQHPWGCQQCQSCSHSTCTQPQLSPCKPLPALLSSFRQREQGVTVTAEWGVGVPQHKHPWCAPRTGSSSAGCPQVYNKLQHTGHCCALLSEFQLLSCTPFPTGPSTSQARQTPLRTKDCIAINLPKLQ